MTEEDSREKYKPEETLNDDEVKQKGNSCKNKVGTTQPETLRANKILCTEFHGAGLADSRV